MTSQPHPPRSTDVRCVRCGYDLTGTAVGALCPECGTPVHRSLHASGVVEGGTSSAGVTCLVLGIVGVTACALLAPFAWWYSVKTLHEAAAFGGTSQTITFAQAGKILGIIGTVLIALQCVIFGLVVAAR